MTQKNDVLTEVNARIAEMIMNQKLMIVSWRMYEKRPNLTECF